MISYNTLSLEKIAARINIKKRPVQPRPPVPVAPMQSRPPAPVAPMQPRPQAPVAPMPPRPPQQSVPVAPMPPRSQSASVPVAPMYRSSQQSVPVAPMYARPQAPTTPVAPMYARPQQSYTLRNNTQFPYNYNRNNQYTLQTNPISQGTYMLPKIEGAHPGSYTLPLRPVADASRGKIKWSDLIDYGSDLIEFAPSLWGDDDDDNYSTPSLMRVRVRRK